MYFNNVLMYIYILLLNVLYHNFNKCYHVAVKTGMMKRGNNVNIFLLQRHEIQTTTNVMLISCLNK